MAIRDQKQLAIKAAPAVVVCAAETPSQDQPVQERSKMKNNWCQSFVKGECKLPSCPFAHLDKQEVEILLRQNEKRRRRNLERVEEHCAPATSFQQLYFEPLESRLVKNNEEVDASSKPCLPGVAEIEAISVLADPPGAIPRGDSQLFYPCLSTESQLTREDKEMTAYGKFKSTHRSSVRNAVVKKVLFHDATVPYERTKSTTSFPVVPSSYLDEAEKREEWDLHVLVSREVALLKAKFIAEIVKNGKPQSPCCVGDVQHVQI
mgnify:CR=1 FL=1